MKRFIIHIVSFLALMIVILAVLLFFIPNKKIVNNSLFSNIDKHHRIDSIHSNKIVFVGGSSTAFGLNSELIEDSLHVPVVNMGLHAGLGLRYMLSEVGGKIGRGDIVIIAPEYHQFIGDVYQGEKVLIALLFDVNRADLKYITVSHAAYLIPQTVEYAVSKIFYKKLDVMGEGSGKSYEKVFKRNSFNKYGDENMHWSYPNQEIKKMSIPDSTVQISINAVKLLVHFNAEMRNKGAKVYIIPPAIQKSSFDNFKPFVIKVEKALEEYNLKFYIEPEEFAYPDSMFFNTVYHLDKAGSDKRSEKIVEFLMNK